MNADDKGKKFFLSDFYSQHLYGRKGETLFHAPYQNLNADLADVTAVFLRMQGFKDDRSKALLAAMACEAIIDMLLEKIMPKYGKLVKDSRDVTFSLKIKLLSSFELVPQHLTRAANMVREVRNAFAHDLKIDKLEDLGDDVKRKMFHYYTERGIAPHEGRNNLDTIFEAIAYGATAGLASYRTCLSDLNAVIRSPDFEAALNSRSEVRHQANIESIRQHVATAPNDPHQA